VSNTSWPISRDEFCTKVWGKELWKRYHNIKKLRYFYFLMYIFDAVKEPLGNACYYYDFLFAVCDDYTLYFIHVVLSTVVRRPRGESKIQAQTSCAKQQLLQCSIQRISRCYWLVLG
jgi:hypothetical protein